MNESDYNPQQDPWYSPNTVVDYFELLRRQYGKAVETDVVFKKAREMFSAAVALFGAYELSSENQYYLQANRQSSSPDIMAGTRTKMSDGSILLAMQQIEIVEMESHANTDDVVQFLQNTKLSPRKGYSDKMMIICFINRIVPIRRKEIYEHLKLIQPKSTIYICGKPIDAPLGTFMMFSPYPALTKPLTYNINETAKKYSLKPSITFSLGKGDIEIPTGPRQRNIYEALGLDRSKIYKKYHVSVDKT